MKYGKPAKLVEAHKIYVFDHCRDLDDKLGQLICCMPVSPTRMHRMDGGKFMSYADNNLLVFLHKLGLRGKSRVPN